MKRLAAALGVLAAAIGLLVPSAAGAGPSTARYVVVLRDDVRDPGAVAAEQARANGADVQRVYRYALKGYVATLPTGRVDALAHDPRVAFVEPDGVATISTTESPAPWGLDRIDQRALPLSGTFSYYNATGAGVTAYIIDTGIFTADNDFDGRAHDGADFVDDSLPATDCNGHGTHVAGTVGGHTYGVAKDVQLVAVRVLDCNGSGYWSDVIAGIDWVVGHRTGPAVANMSLGGSANSAVDTAVRNAITAGVTFAIAAGNGNAGGRAQDACKYSPARVTEAITVSATDSSDRKASWANYGSCVDLFAPGVSITSDWLADTTKTISGTSMATPHVTGVAALYLQGNPTAAPATVRDALWSNATTSVVKSSNTTNPRLLYTNY